MVWDDYDAEDMWENLNDQMKSFKNSSKLYLREKFPAFYIV